MSKTQKILVIGACGQLGSELTHGLYEVHGRENVVATDVRASGNVTSFHHFELLDVLDRQALDNLIKEHHITQIYHLAAILSAVGEQYPKKGWELNMNGLINVLDAAVDHTLDKIYWPSSIAVFGPSTPKQQTPQHTVTDPTTIYGISKLAGEQWCAWYHKKYGVDVRSLRYPGLIGYKAKAGGGTTDYAVDIFGKAIADKQYTCFLKHDAYLPMMYMDDAVKATIDLMEAPAEKIHIRSSYNISAMSFCPADIAAEIKKHIPEFEIDYNPDGRQRIAESWPQSIDDSQARADWGWCHQYGLAEMTREILAHRPQFLEQSVAG